MYYYDSTMLILIPGIILTMFAQWKIMATYSKYSQIQCSRGTTGAEVARALLNYAGIRDVGVEQVAGKLSDHYDPNAKMVRLSPDIFGGNSIASLSVAAHEVGHAIQHNQEYAPLNFRSALVPVANFGSNFSMIFIMAGLFFGIGGSTLLNIGILLFSASVLFQVVTLPVEFNASDRALEMLEQHHFLQSDEVKGARRVLNSAALTYVAATLSAILSLIRLIMIANRNND